MIQIKIGTKINGYKVIDIYATTRCYVVLCNKCKAMHDLTEYQINNNLFLCPCKDKKSPKKTPVESTITRQHNTYAYSARSRGFVFELTEKDTKEYMFSPCYWCLRAPYRGTTRSGHIVFNGIDRLDSHVGYTLSNTVPCCWTCNDMKGTLGVEDFLSQCKAIMQAHCQ